MRLSKLSSTNELNAIKTGGISFTKIIFICLKTGSLIVIMTFLIGEFIAPKGQQLANNVKNLSQSTRLSMKNTDGIWIRAKTVLYILLEVFLTKLLKRYLCIDSTRNNS